MTAAATTNQGIMWPTLSCKKAAKMEAALPSPELMYIDFSIVCYLDVLWHGCLLLYLCLHLLLLCFVLVEHRQDLG